MRMLPRVASAKTPLASPPLHPAGLRPLFYCRPQALPGSSRLAAGAVVSDTANRSHRGASWRTYRTLAGRASQSPRAEEGSALSGSATGQLCFHRATAFPHSVNNNAPGCQPRLALGPAALTTATTSTVSRPYTTSSRKESLIVGGNNRVPASSSLEVVNKHRRVLALATVDIDGRCRARGYASSTTSGEQKKMYTASFAFFEAIWEAGITHCFVNLGSDHPSIIEAMVKGQREKRDKFPRIITCPNEVGDPGYPLEDSCR